MLEQGVFFLKSTRIGGIFFRALRIMCVQCARIMRPLRTYNAQCAYNVRTVCAHKMCVRRQNSSCSTMPVLSWYVHTAVQCTYLAPNQRFGAYRTYTHHTTTQCEIGLEEWIYVRTYFTLESSPMDLVRVQYSIRTYISSKSLISSVRSTHNTHARTTYVRAKEKEKSKEKEVENYQPQFARTPPRGGARTNCVFFTHTPPEHARKKYPLYGLRPKKIPPIGPKGRQITAYGRKKYPL